MRTLIFWFLEVTARWIDKSRVRDEGFLEIGGVVSLGVLPRPPSTLNWGYITPNGGCLGPIRG